jgi:hypothetical protein
MKMTLLPYILMLAHVEHITLYVVYMYVRRLAPLPHNMLAWLMYMKRLHPTCGCLNIVPRLSYI